MTVEIEAQAKGLTDMVEGSGLPGHMKHSLLLYLLEGVPTGGCLRKMLSDQFLRAWPYADKEYRRAVPELIRVLTDHKMPYDAVGSDEKVSAWISRGGLKGRADD